MIFLDIGWIHLPENYDLPRDGGNIYTSYMLSAVSTLFNIEPIGIVFNRKQKIRSGFKNIYRLLKLKGNKDVWVRDYLSMLTLPFDRTIGKNLIVVHHIDSSVLAYPFLFKLTDKIFYRNLKYIDELVVGSEYWKDYFKSFGYNPKVIYSCFDFDEFEFTHEELTDFKKKFGLCDKKIVYIGNCQKAKGVVEAYEALKDLDVHLVTSGLQTVKIPAINLNLTYRDYLLLLKVSSVVVTMSLFKEGWCRTAHEAMLCQTPVIGSGLGGMAELLEGGQQIICRDFSDLKNNVEFLLDNPEIGLKGYSYASQKKFTVEHFQKEWVKIFSEMK